MKQININYDDSPIILKDGDVLQDMKIKGVGSKYGRFIFTDSLIGIQINNPGNRFNMNNLIFESLDIGININSSNVVIQGVV